MIVGEFIQNEVKQIFKDNKVPEYLNRTNIVLIPKIAGSKLWETTSPLAFVTLSTRSHQR